MEKDVGINKISREIIVGVIIVVIGAYFVYKLNLFSINPTYNVSSKDQIGGFTGVVNFNNIEKKLSEEHLEKLDRELRALSQDRKMSVTVIMTPGSDGEFFVEIVKYLESKGWAVLDGRNILPIIQGGVDGIKIKKYNNTIGLFVGIF